MTDNIICKQENQIEAFDWGLYAALIRKARKDLGYTTAQAFANSIYRRTRIKVSRETLYKIEMAKQVPSATVFMALNLALYKDPFPKQIIEFCTCQEWKDILRNDGKLPYSWKSENLDDARRDLWLGGCEQGDYTIDEIANRLGDKPDVFANGDFYDFVSIGVNDDPPF